MKDLEVRYMPGAELRAEEAEGGVPRLIGYAAVWESDSHELSSPRGKFVERITRGAFRRSLESTEDIKALYDHDPSKILARRSSDVYPLTIEEDDHGLRVEIIPPVALSYGADCAECVRSKLATGMSFAFKVNDDAWSLRDGKRLRELRDVTLFEVSIVIDPAYPQTSVNLRSMEAWEKEQSHHSLDNAKRRLRLADLA